MKNYDDPSKIQLLRKKHGWTQEELAERLDISRQALSKWELGTAVPDTVNVLKISKLFSVPTDYLLDDELESPEEFERKYKGKQIINGTRLSEKAKRLIEEKGYMAGYILAGSGFLGLTAISFICYAYLSILASIAPLQEFPLQAFIIPIAAGIVGILIILRIVFYLVLAHKLKRAIKDCDCMKKNVSRIIGLIMVVIAVVFVVFALNHPEMSFPWSNTITWVLYGLYAIVTAVLLIAPTKKN